MSIHHRTAGFGTVAFPNFKRHPMPLQYSRNAVNLDICKSFSQNTNKSQRLARTTLLQAR